MKNYEGMFLFDPGMLTDWESVQKEVHRILERAEAQVVACSRWDERRLAYEIKGRKRGIYALTYFKADPSKIAGIERDINLSESALRCLIIKVDHMTDDEMKEAASSTRIEQQKSAGFGDSDSDEGGMGEGGPSRRPRREAEEVPAEIASLDAVEEE